MGLRPAMLLFCWQSGARKPRPLKFWKKRKKLLEEQQDQFGRVAVYEQGDLRYLMFAENMEQSCSKVNAPHWLEYQYARAMLLGATLFEHPESALFLGLGSGSLTNASLEYFDSLYDVEVIELRQSVVELAARHLGFNQHDERLTIRIGDGHKLLNDASPADLIFMDMYDESGPANGHLAWYYLQRCRSKLNPGGWLIINQWATPGNKPLGAPLLRGVFEHHYWEIPVSEGNVILLVPQDMEQELDQQQLGLNGKLLEQRYGYKLAPMLKQLCKCSS